ncbi:hypothetical protein [Mucilaginibacter psychrotolerans]|uniref:Uncharacterized protein n=1 Tax=Mucilaginibacter psychrotolerans TaxID=1524096 RepID=A0A4Y8S9V3_9SPHI|nr:hypothetical protein [Mucilaginibacter psychrotolerans]TFF35204.1 hypothetical protein E2R66_19765 [Mucilaginibacter psychrotolerans]
MHRIDKPQLTLPTPWEGIEAFFRDLLANGWALMPMVDLIMHITGTKLHERLFAYTSLDTLATSIYNPIEFGRETLRIKFNRHLQQWHFSYSPKQFEPAEFDRTYAADKGIEKFDNFIRMMKW